jgi:hypothetical protein
MERTIEVAIFVPVAVLILASALAFIFLGGLSPQFVGLAAAIAVAASVLVFSYRFSATKKNASIPTPTKMSASSGLSTPRSPGITFLRIVTIATLSVGAIMVVTFVMEASMGTLNSDDVRRFVPKAVFAVALAGYVFHKTRNRPPS